jgi:hypothetical protein
MKSTEYHKNICKILFVCFFVQANSARLNFMDISLMTISGFMTFSVVYLLSNGC